MTDSLPGAALKGLRVLDLSRVLAGPWTTQILGDLGADVIKVEHPGKGDDTRAWGPPFTEARFEDGTERMSAYFLSCNRNKRSVAIDISTPHGIKAVLELARQSDVFVENFKVGGLAKYGLDFKSVFAINPRIIYCSITGFGQTGPRAKQPGYDFLIQGMSGLMSITGQPKGSSGEEPMKVGVAVSDVFTGLYATISILAALQHRNITGEGQHIDCSLLDTQLAVLANQGTNWLVGGIVPEALGNNHPNVVPYRTYPVRDGHIIIATGNDSQFRSLCCLLGMESLSEDQRFADNSARLEHRADLDAILARATSEWQSRDLIDAMIEAGVPGGPINRIDQAFADPQVRARDLVQPMRLGDRDSFHGVGYPARLSLTPAQYRRGPPRLGEHTREILQGVLQLTPDELAKFEE